MFIHLRCLSNCAPLVIDLGRRRGACAGNMRPRVQVLDDAEDRLEVRRPKLTTVEVNYHS